MRHQLVGEAFGEVLLLGIAGQILQGQDDDGADGSAAAARAWTAEPERDGSGESGKNDQRQSKQEGDTTVSSERFRRDSLRWRGVRCGCGHGIEEPIAAPAHGLDIARLRGGIAQRAPQPVDGAADAVVEIDEGAVGPKAVPQFFPRDNLARLLHESNEQLEWAVLEPDADAVPAQFAGAYIHGKPAELESRNVYPATERRPWSNPRAKRA